MAMPMAFAIFIRSALHHKLSPHFLRLFPLPLPQSKIKANRFSPDM